MGKGRVPATLAPAFQEYALETLELDRDRNLIIERVLAFGDRAQFRWLFGAYPKEIIAGWVRESGHRRLPWRRYTLWCVLLDIPRRPRESSLWPH